jgi:C-terminal processing protease CtpA/Prc
VQIANRGKVLGDRTAGRVMISQYYDRKIGMGSALDFGASITVADIIMTDGKSLEKNGVTPDEVLLPDAEDLASDRDPVLSRAAALCGVPLDPARAGALFPFEWKR